MGQRSLLGEITTHPRNCQINFTYLAMKYQLQNHKNETPKNAGQILRHLLIDTGINVDQYLYRYLLTNYWFILTN